MIKNKIEDGSSQIDKDKFTQIPNYILERLIKIPFKGCELAVALFVIRKTYGFHKKTDEISISQFCKGLSRSRQTIVTAQENLKITNIIKLLVKGKSKRSSNLWDFNRDIETWKLGDMTRLVKRTHSTSLINEPELVDTSRHTKEKITKESLQNIQEDEEEYPSGFLKKQKEKKLKISDIGQVDPAEISELLLLSEDEAMLVRAFIDKGCSIPKDFSRTIWHNRIEYEIEDYYGMAKSIRNMDNYSHNANNIFQSCCNNYISKSVFRRAKIQSKLEGASLFERDRIIKGEELRDKIIDIKKNSPKTWGERVKSGETFTKEDWEYECMTEKEQNERFKDARPMLDDEDCDDYYPWKTKTIITEEEANIIESEAKKRRNKEIIFGDGTYRRKFGE